MGSNFDDILQKGKTAGGATEPKKLWKNCITTLMYELHRLNQMYGDNFTHHLMIEQKKCDKCEIATFIVAVREYGNHKRVLKFHKGDWIAVGEGVYRCESCKKGK